jgi:hypothetical protein
MTEDEWQASRRELAEAQARMARSEERMDKAVPAMVETHAHVGARVDAFIGVLDRFISEGRNGKS